jgi:hypothetical protein
VVSRVCPSLFPLSLSPLSLSPLSLSLSLTMPLALWLWGSQDLADHQRRGFVARLQDAARGPKADAHRRLRHV